MNKNLDASLYFVWTYFCSFNNKINSLMEYLDLGDGSEYFVAQSFKAVARSVEFVYDLLLILPSTWDKALTLS